MDFLTSAFQSHSHWLIFIICLPLGWLLKGLFVFLASKWTGIFVSGSKDAVSQKFKTFKKPLGWFFLFLFYFFCADFLRLDEKGLSPLMTLIKIGAGASAVFLLPPAVNIFIDFLRKKFQLEKDPLYNQFFLLIKKVLNASIFIVGGLMIVQNMGYNITSLIAGLGVGGLAAALAAKDTLANVFGSIVILFDRPFVTGDWIQFDSYEGTVTRVGFRSTQIKTFYDSVVSVPNSILANAKIDNLGKRKARRSRFTLGLAYSTPPEKILSFVKGVENIIKNHSKTKKDYFQVSFSGYADSSLNVFVNFFLHVANWNEELLERQGIFIEILKLSKTINVDFAFPSRSLYIENPLSISENKPQL